MKNLKSLMLLFIVVSFVGCMKTDKNIDKLNPLEKITYWADIHLEEKPSKLDAESFIETAISSIHPINGQEFTTVDTISFEYPRPSSMNRSQVVDFSKELYSNVNHFIDNHFEGIDVSIWVGSTNLIVQCLVFSKKETYIDTRSFCLYEDGSYNWHKFNVPDECTFENAPSSLSKKFNFGCHLTKGQQEIFCFKPEGGTTLNFKLTPSTSTTGGAGNSWDSNLPCNTIQKCIEYSQENGTTPRTFSPATCNGPFGNTPYCEYLLFPESETYKYKLLWDIAPYDYCLTSDMMNDYQEMLADFSLSMMHDGLYGLTSNDSPYYAFLEGIGNVPYQVHWHEAVIIYARCVPSFN